MTVTQPGPGKAWLEIFTGDPRLLGVIWACTAGENRAKARGGPGGGVPLKKWTLQHVPISLWH